MAKHLFIDDRFVAETSGLTRRFHQACKCDRNPVIRADRPWEKDAAFIDSAMVVYDEASGRFRAWYQGGACYGPDDGSNMCYATSADGIDWDKPSLGVVEFEGSTDNNIVLAATCMMHDPAPIIDPADPDPLRRYKAVWWGGRRDAAQEGGWLLGHCVGFSADGIRWQEHPGNPVWVGDAEVAVPFGLARTGGRLVMYSSADGYGMRVTARSESDDFVRWDLPPAPVFVPDDDDPPGTEAAGLAATDYEGTHVGMLWVAGNLPEPAREEWRRIVERNKRQGFFGPPIEMNNVRCREMHTELVTSPDGVRWDRIRREPLIPLGPEGSWDRRGAGTRRCCSPPAPSCTATRSTSTTPATAAPCRRPGRVGWSASSRGTSRPAWRRCGSTASPPSPPKAPASCSPRRSPPTGRRSPSTPTSAGRYGSKCRMMKAGPWRA